MQRKPTKISRLNGALYGFIIGDAMGATNEFKSSEQCKANPITDIVGGGWLNLKAGQVTDDTEMMLCVADAIIKGPTEAMKLQLMCNRFSHWYLNNPVDVGFQCKNVISQCAGLPYTCWTNFAYDDQALGNGSLMRTLPCVLLNQSEDLAMLQGRLTHNNKTCDNAIKCYYNILMAILHDEGIGGFSAIDELMEPTGHVINTLNNAIYYWVHSFDFEQSMLEVVNNGGDTDTIGAITGSLLGAEYGIEAIPERWINQIDQEVKEKIKNIF